MKKITLIVTVVIATTITSPLFAQVNFAKIDKNRNVQASGLYHDLNKTKDTLVLKSDRKINYVYALNGGTSPAKEYYIDKPSYKIALNQFKKGKHVFVAVQQPLQIVFVVYVLKDIPILTTEVRTNTSNPVLAHQDNPKTLSPDDSNRR
ncbi:hypothetical protein Q2T40_14000 [Winogradskyella maritima]|uniref:Uncharacterized protein n=1 Tax=Winogradskyella maritima TaxID=1517766 RepID=A0ABV8AGP0_9FLAO|nr:hypothetical protein [Winogradskyella maritima]